MNKTELTMEKRQQELVLAIDEKEWPDCWKLLKGLSEEERRALTKTVKERLKHWKKVDLEWFKQPRAPRNQYPNVILCALATFSLSELKKGGSDLLPWHSETRLVDIFTDRKPTWMKEWCEYALEKRLALWSVVWILKEEGRFDIDGEDFFLGMWMNCVTLAEIDDGQMLKMHYLSEVGENKLSRQLFEKHPSLVDKVWGLFELDYRPMSDDPMQIYDDFWTALISYLVEEKKLPREKVLSLLFDCLARDLHELRVKWLCSLHDELNLNSSEKEKYVTSYLNLLDSKRKTAVKLAFSFVKEAVKEDKLAYDQLVPYLASPLNSTTKAIAKQAITLLKSAAKKQPDLKPEIVKVLSSGFLNQAVDIQETCIDLLVSVCDTVNLSEATLDEIKDSARMLETSNAKKLSKWMDQIAPSVSGEIGLETLSDSFDATAYDALVAEAKEIPVELAELSGIGKTLDQIKELKGIPGAIEFDPFNVPRLREECAIVPFDSHESLIDTLLYVIEHPEDVDQVERCLSGMARFPVSEDAEFLALSKPLEKRTIQILKRNPEQASHVVLLLTILVWLHNNKVKDYNDVVPLKHLRQLSADSKYYLRSYTLLLSRFANIASRLEKRKPTELLSSPTHKDGWIDPLELVRRANELDPKRERDKLDECFSLLRLAFDRRGEALKNLHESKDEYVRALRYVLDPDYDLKKASLDLWVAASRARHPLFEDKTLVKRIGKNQSGITTGGEFSISVKPPGRLDDGSKSTYNCLQVQVDPAPQKDSEHFTGALYEPQTSWSDRFPEPLWLFSSWPSGIEVIQSRAVRHISNNIDFSEVVVARENRVYIEKLMDPDLPMTGMSLACLSIALNAKMPDETGPALESLIAAIEDGRLDQQKLKDGLSLFLNTDLFMPNRLGKVLLEAGRVSPLHNLVIAETIQNLVSNIEDKPPRGFHYLLEALLQHLSESGEKIFSESVRETFGKLPATGKTKKIVKQILDLEGVPNENFRQEARFMALQARVERARRWQECKPINENKS